MNKTVNVSSPGTGYTTAMNTRSHKIIMDEPIDLGGNDFGPTPTEFLCGALGACTAITLKMYARRKKWELEDVIVDVELEKKFEKDENGRNQRVDTFMKKIQLKGNLDEDQKQRLLEIAGKCPVNRTIAYNKVIMQDELT